jgi:hypothetical protein
MKTELRFRPHASNSHQNVVELWHNEEFIGTITGAEGPGVRVITKHSIQATTVLEDDAGVNVLEVEITLN